MKKIFFCLWLCIISQPILAQQKTAAPVTLSAIVIHPVDSKSNFKKYRKALKNSWLKYKGGTAIVKGTVWNKNKKSQKKTFSAHLNISGWIDYELAPYTLQEKGINTTLQAWVKERISNLVKAGGSSWKNSHLRRISKRLQCKKEGQNTWLFEVIKSNLKKQNKVRNTMIYKSYLSQKVTLSNYGRIQKIKATSINFGKVTKGIQTFYYTEDEGGITLAKAEAFITFKDGKTILLEINF